MSLDNIAINRNLLSGELLCRMSLSCRLCSLSGRIISVDCKNTKQAVVMVKLSKEISHTAFKYMQVEGEKINCH